MKVSFVSKDPDCGIVLYNSDTGGERRIPFSEKKRQGNVYFGEITDLLPEETSYLFYQGDQLIPDEHGLVFPGMSEYGKKRTLRDKKAGIVVPEFDWGEEEYPYLPFSESIMYCLHVRGFTKHMSSGVSSKGSFNGIREKIPYLKEIGITTLELQPCYEFEEIEEKADELQYLSSMDGCKAKVERKINYWGYKKGYYYAPKAAYAENNPVTELKGLIKELHKNKMELIMQFYFPLEVNRNEIRDILRFWANEYHVDGFHLMGENLPVEMIAGDQMLADRKILFYRFNGTEIEEFREYRGFPHLCEYNDQYMYDMRKFLKGDENTLEKALQNMRYLPSGIGAVHYMTNYYGLTLADLVSYDYKHNEANGENNRDGNDYNASWNCGEEGITRSKKIKKLRFRQLKNAMCLLMFSQSIPLIFMGDEFGNSQKGNNNPWCQDNTLTWLDWSVSEKNHELLSFWKELVELRRNHKVLHPEKAMQMMDTGSCGYPDLSYHDENAWRGSANHHQRYMGIMMCETEKERKTTTGEAENCFIYLAINMHWEKHKLAFPRLPKGLTWRLLIDTSEESPKQDENEIIHGVEDVKDLFREIPPRSIAVLVSEKEPENKAKKKTGKVIK